MEGEKSDGKIPAKNFENEYFQVFEIDFEPVIFIRQEHGR
jgi:hypothetical protein